MMTIRNKWLDNICLLLGINLCMAATCNFPEYLQHSGDRQDRFWHFRRQDGVHYDKHVYFWSDNDTELLTKENKQVNTLDIVCVKYLADIHAYLVRQISSDDVTTFACLSFVEVTPNVITLRKSVNAVIPKPELCNAKNLKQYEWPLIASYPRQGVSYRSSCPFVGGFLLVISQGGRIFCQSCPYSSLLHSECFPGDGIRINFCHKSCIPTNTNWSTDQHLVCLDSWRDTSSIYGMLAERYYEPKWLYRLSLVRSHENSLQLAITADFRPPADYSRPEVSSFDLSLTLIDDQRECRDGIAVCGTDICENTIYSQLCPHTCAKCDELLLDSSRNHSCLFNERFQGNWVQHSGDVVKHVNVTDDIISFEDYAEFYCFKQHSESSYVLTTKSKNGCRPQYVCINLVKATGIVMTYRISRSSYRSSSGEDLCHDENFKPHNEPLAGVAGVYRSAYYKSVVDDGRVLTSSTLCELNGRYRVHAYHGERRSSCLGWITDSDPEFGPDALVLNLNCSRESSQIITEVYKCIGHITAIREGDRMILTRRYLNQTSLVLNCWIFAGLRSDNVTFTMLSSAQCDEGRLNDRQIRIRGQMIDEGGVPLDVTTENVAMATNLKNTIPTDVWQDETISTGQDLLKLYTVNRGVGESDTWNRQRTDKIARVAGFVFLCFVVIWLISVVSYLSIRISGWKRRRYTRMAVDEDKTEDEATL